LVVAFPKTPALNAAGTNGNERRVATASQTAAAVVAIARRNSRLGSGRVLIAVELYGRANFSVNSASAYDN
jgi:hypothetical protein